MKKLVILVPTLFIALLATTIIAAAGVEITLEQEDDFYQGELLQAEIVGGFIEGLELKNIAIYKEGDVHSSSPLSSSNLYRSGNKYLYYAVLPYTIGNFSLEVRDAKYYVGQEISEETVALNFTISENLDPYLSVNKGFIVATDDFEITVKSFNAVQEVTVAFPEGESLTKEIGYNSEKKFKFSIDGVEEYTESSLELAGISVPVFITPRVNPPEPFINGTEKDYLEEDESGPEEPEPVALEEATTEQIQTCADIGGRICKKGEECKGPSSYARGVECCTGECVEKESSNSWIWGVILLFALAGGLYWYYKKSKKQSKPKTSKQELQKRTEKFKERTHPKPSKAIETRKSLTRT